MDIDEKRKKLLRLLSGQDEKVRGHLLEPKTTHVESRVTNKLEDYPPEMSQVEIAEQIASAPIPNFNQGNLTKEEIQTEIEHVLDLRRTKIEVVTGGQVTLGDDNKIEVWGQDLSGYSEMGIISKVSDSSFKEFVQYEPNKRVGGNAKKVGSRKERQHQPGSGHHVANQDQSRPTMEFVNLIDIPKVKETDSKPRKLTVAETFRQKIQEAFGKVQMGDPTSGSKEPSSEANNSEAQPELIAAIPSYPEIRVQAASPPQVSPNGLIQQNEPEESNRPNFFDEIISYFQYKSKYSYFASMGIFPGNPYFCQYFVGSEPTGLMVPIRPYGFWPGVVHPGFIQGFTPFLRTSVDPSRIGCNGADTDEDDNTRPFDTRPGCSLSDTT